MDPLKDRLIAASTEFLLFFLIGLFGLKVTFLESIGMGFILMSLIELLHFATDV